MTSKNLSILTLIAFLTQVFTPTYGWARIAQTDVLAGTTAPLPDATEAVQTNSERDGDCDVACKQYFDEKDNLIAKACPTPTPGTEDSYVNHNGVNYATHQDCINALTAEKGADQLGPPCESIKLIQNAINLNIATAVLYGLGAGACGAACAIQLSGVGAVVALPPAEALCVAFDTGAMVTDLAATIKLSVDGQKAQDKLNAELKFDFGAGSSNMVGVAAGSSAATLGAGGVAMGVGMRGALQRTWDHAKDLAGKAVDTLSGKAGEKAGTGAGEKAGQNASKEAGENVSKEVGEKVAGEAGENAGKTATKEGTEQASKDIGPCISAGLLTLVMGVKIGMVADGGVLKKAKNSACNNVKALKALNAGTILTRPTSGVSDYKTLDAHNASGSGTGAAMTAASLSADPEIPTDSMGRADIGKLVAAATSGLNGFPPERLRELADGHKDKIQDLLRELKKGDAAGAVMSVSPELSSGPVGEMFAKVGGYIQEGRVQAEVGSAVMSSGNGGGTSNSKNSASIFALGGRLTPSGKSGTTETKFDKPKLAIDSNDDIFHTKWTGTIFQLVSLRLENSKNKIDTLEWASPLNRALLGLPPLKPSMERGRSK